MWTSAVDDGLVLNSTHPTTGLIAYYRTNSLQRYFPHIPTHLVHPLGGQQFCVRRARAKHQFRPANGDELAMEKEDELEVRKDDGDWLLCRSKRGEGMVPANHTKPFVE